MDAHAYAARDQELQDTAQKLYADVVKEVCALIDFTGPASEKKYYDICRLVSEYGVAWRAEGQHHGEFLGG